MSKANAAPIVVNGWRLFAHPLFLDQLDSLIAEVERLRRKDPEGYRSKNASKRLAAVMRLMLNDIPQDPGRKDYRQGSTLGPEHRHWHRAKFFQQYRLFFRFHNRSKVIVLGWVNDTDTKRAYGSKTDAYRVFQTMLANGHPPDDWDELLREANPASERMRTLTARTMDPESDSRRGLAVTAISGLTAVTPTSWAAPIDSSRWLPYRSKPQSQGLVLCRLLPSLPAVR